MQEYALALAFGGGGVVDHVLVVLLLLLLLLQTQPWLPLDRLVYRGGAREREGELHRPTHA